MSPGYIGSSAGRRGAGFNTGPRFHGHGFGRIAAPAPRQNFAQRTTQFSGVRQRFSVGGDGKITLDSGEQLVVAVDENGAVSIGVGNSEPVNGPAAPAANGRSGAARMRRKMSLYTGTDGEVVIAPRSRSSAIRIAVRSPLSSSSRCRLSPRTAETAKTGNKERHLFAMSKPGRGGSHAALSRVYEPPGTASGRQAAGSPARPARSDLFDHRTRNGCPGGAETVPFWNPLASPGGKPPVCGTFSVRAVSRPPYVRRWGRSWPDIGVIGHQDLRLAAVCVRGTPRPFVPPRALAYGFGGTAKQGCCPGIGQPAADFGVDHRVAPQQAPGRARTRPVAGANKAGQRGERCPSI